MKFRRILTRFGQLPLLFLIWLAVSILATYSGNMQSRDEQLLHWVQLSNISSMLGGFDWISTSLLSGFSLFCSYSLGSIIKRIHYKPRPNPQPYTNRREKIDASSFPSIHTSNSLIMAVRSIIAVSWWIPLQSCTLNPTIFPCPMSWIFSAAAAPWRMMLWILFYILISYSRVILRKHYRIDILW